ncbi:MAG: iron-regulated protein A precursor [Bdellovibrionales bacterium]|nr:iron-regulated protein A precursor [Bdellovibrionales bacterium]
MKQFFQTATLLSLLVLGVFGCSQEKGNSAKGGDKPIVTKPDNNADLPLDVKVVRNIAYYVILETYKDLSKESRLLYNQIEELYRQPSQENLERAQQAWRNTRRPWEATEGFLFGPVESLGIDPMIDTWPLNRVDIEAIISSSHKIDSLFVKSLGTNVQGFHTIEFLLFGNGETKQKKSLPEMTTREIEYLLATSLVLAEHTERLAFAWETNENPDDPKTPGYVITIMNPSPDNPRYPSVRSILAEYINGLIGIVDEVANGKIADPMGDSINSADVTKVESPFSWNSIADFTDNIESVKAVYTGDYGAVQGPGIDELIQLKDPQLARQVISQIDRSIASIQAISENGTQSFRQAILKPDGRVRVNQAVQELHTLFDLLEQKVLPLINQ